MLQKGVEIQTLDVHYVSSFSMYFLVLFGLSGLQNLVLQSEVQSQFSQQMSQMNPMGGP